MKTKVFYLLGLIGLTISCWWTATFLFGSSQSISILIQTAIFLLSPILLLLASRRVGIGLWIITGFVILVMLIMPDKLIVNLFLGPLTQSNEGLVSLTQLMTICAAIAIAAVLLQSGLNSLTRENARIEELGDTLARRKLSQWVAVIALALSALVLAQALDFFYWFMVWDTTNDPLGILWLFFPIPTVLFSSFGLFIFLPGRTKLTSFMYFLLIPAFIAVSIRAQSVDFRQLTEERAGQVSQAIEAFHAHGGSYPHSLGQLVPWYIVSLPSPLIIYTQEWCYDGGDNYYRLGYVNRDHWSDPNLYGRIYKSNGEIPDLPSLCVEEIATLKKRYGLVGPQY